MRNQHPTRLALFCEHIIEGCWLIALVVTPLFFNVYSNRIFEPDKTAMLRSIILIMGLAWIVRGLEQWAANRTANGINQEPSNDRSIWRRFAAVPVLSLAVLFLIDYAFATFISVAPRFSLLGSYARLQGLYTTGAYVGVFLSILGLMRTRAQFDRMIAAVLVASLPVSLYGIIQYFGTDPLAWGSDVTVRVASSMGNPLFLAAYLILVVPLTLYRILLSASIAAESEMTGTKRALMTGGLISLAFQMAAWQAGPTAGTASAVITVTTWVGIALLLRKPLIPFLRISSYTVLLSAQLMCILFSKSRGPWIALVVGLFVFALLWSIVQRRRRQTALVIGSGVTIALFLVVLNLAGTQLEKAGDFSYLGRFAQLSKTDAGTGRVRVLIWEGIEDLLGSNPIRTVAGYGPETLQFLYPRHHRPELGHVQKTPAMADRSHNETFDVLVTTGFTGLLIYILFFTSLLYYGLWRIGLIESLVHRKAFLGLWFAGGLSGALLVFAIDGSWRFAGISMPAGMLAGLLAYICGFGILVKSEQRLSIAERWPRLLVVALLSALITHFVEIQLGLAIVATRTYFWSYAGLLAALAFFQRERSDLAEDAKPEADMALVRPAVRSIAGGPVVISSLVAGFILVTVAYDFLIPRAMENASTILWLLVFSWGLAGFVIITELFPNDQPVIDFGKAFWVVGIYSGVTLTMLLFYTTVHAGASRFGDDQGIIVLAYSGMVLLTLIGLGLSILWDERPPKTTFARWLGLPYLLLTAGCLAAVYMTNLSVVLGDVYFKQASQVHRLGLLDQAIALNRRALDIQPKQDFYYLGLGKILLQKAEASEDPPTGFQEAEGALLAAQALSPLNPDHAANVARLYAVSAEWSRTPSDRTRRFNQTITQYKHATKLSPNAVSLWNEMGSTYLLLGDTTEARRIYQHALTIDGASYQTHQLVGNLDLAQQRWHEAARSYEKALQIEPDLPQVRLALRYATAQMSR